MKLSSKLKLGFIAITGILAVVGFLSVQVADEVDKLRTVELPMEQTLRELEVGLWQATHAANAFQLSGSSSYVELHRQQVAIVDRLVERQSALLDGQAAEHIGLGA